jgi:hypothetical protein
VDEAIRPLPGATVTITMGLESLNGTTDEKGAFRFDRLEPGAWLVVAERAGFLPALTTRTVLAGHDEYIKLQVAREIGGAVFYLERKIEGFLECYVGIANACFMANFYSCVAFTAAGQSCTNLTNDDSFFVIPEVQDLRRIPDWTQAEMVWDAVQPQFPYMMMRLDVILEPPLIHRANSSYGASPVLVALDRAFADEAELGTNASLGLEAFSYGNQALCDADPDVSSIPAAGDDLEALLSTCYATVLLNQDITYFVHVFYGYLPDEGWRFTDGQTVPPPQ